MSLAVPPKETLTGENCSVIIPLYNGSSYIWATLDSIAAQTVRPAQIIVVDDGSRDGGDDLARSHPLRPTVIQGEGRGVACARNLGALAASSEWLLFVDQDDLWHSHRLEVLAQLSKLSPHSRLLATSAVGFAVKADRVALEHHARAGLVGIWVDNGAFGDIEADSTISSGWRIPEQLPVRVVESKAFMNDVQFVTTTVAYDRTAFFTAGGFAPWARSADDHVLAAVASSAEPILEVTLPLLFYRVHPTSVSHDDDLAVPFLASVVALVYGGGLGDHKTPVETIASRPFAASLVAHSLTDLASSQSPGTLRKFMGFWLLTGTQSAILPYVKRRIRASKGASWRLRPSGPYSRGSVLSD